MGAVRDENFYVVHGWMINRLHLKGNELQLYAIIYGFSQTEGQKFHGSVQYLADWTNIAKRNVYVRLQSLVEKGLLIKNDVYINGVKTCEYRCNTNAVCSDETSSGVVMKHHRSGDETSSEAVMKHHSGGDETSPNNIVNNIYIKDIDNTKSTSQPERYALIASAFSNPMHGTKTATLIPVIADTAQTVNPITAQRLRLTNARSKAALTQYRKSPALRYGQRRAVISAYTSAAAMWWRRADLVTIRLFSGTS